MLVGRRVFVFFSIMSCCLFGAVACGGCDDSQSTPTGPSDATSGDAAPDGAQDAAADTTTDAAPDVAPPDDSGGADADASCPGVVCDDQCCAAGEECVEDQCLPPCAGTRCGDDLGLCCGGDELCLGGGCVLPGDDCERTEQCPVDAFCEPTVGKCVPRSSVDVCEYRPPVGEFSPSVACSWPGPITPAVDPDRTAVIINPLVANLTDDNGDGRTDTEDRPNIVILTRTGGCCNNPATLRILDGECNDDGSMTEIFAKNDVQMINDSAPALGDLTGNGVPEIAVISHTGPPRSTSAREQPQGVVVLTRVADDGTEWDVLWRNPDYPARGAHTFGGAAISIADLDADDNPEIIVGNVVLNGQTGDLKWDGNVTSGGEGGVGNNAFLGPISSVGDTNLDGNQEVAAGNTLYDHEGNVVWTYEYTSSNSSCHGGARDNCDGYTAMANFDSDPEAEIVIVRLGEVFVLNHDGSLLWKQQIPHDSCSRNGQPANEGGPPTVADFNGDGHPDIGLASSDYYTVLSMQCDPPNAEVPDECDSRGVLWAVENNDCSSRVTASSVFDFEGDGKAEMVYADETTFYIYDGTDGTILFEDNTHSSNTRIEMPLVADADNSGSANVLVPDRSGLKVWADTDDNWVRTRRIWNQHAYSVTNIDEDGHIPAVPQPNWRNGRLNNFRQNIQPGGLFDAPDLAIEELGLGGACRGADNVEVTVTVANNGAVGVNAGMEVDIYVEHDGNLTLLDRLQTSQRLLPGQHEALSTSWSVPDGWWNDGFELSAQVDPDTRVNECDEDNNELSADSATLAVDQPGLDIAELDIFDAACAASSQISIELTVENMGNDTIAAGAPILLEALRTANTETITTVTTSAPLAPGETELIEVDWNVTSNLVGTTFEVQATIDADGQVFECSQKNDARADVDCLPGG
jgi:hypothetical protein